MPPHRKLRDGGAFDSPASIGAAGDFLFLLLDQRVDALLHLEGGRMAAPDDLRFLINKERRRHAADDIRPHGGGLPSAAAFLAPQMCDALPTAVGDVFLPRLDFVVATAAHHGGLRVPTGRTPLQDVAVLLHRHLAWPAPRRTER